MVPADEMVAGAVGLRREGVIEEDVPEHPLPHVIDRYVGFDCIRQTPKRCYSDAGRPSIGRRASASCHADGYLPIVTSERKLIGELLMHLA